MIDNSRRKININSFWAISKLIFGSKNSFWNISSRTTRFAHVCNAPNPKFGEVSLNSFLFFRQKNCYPAPSRSRREAEGPRYILYTENLNGPTAGTRVRDSDGTIFSLPSRGERMNAGRLSGADELRALNEGRIWPHANFSGTGTNPGYFRMRPDTSGCVGILNSSKFRRILAKFRQHLGKI